MRVFLMAVLLAGVCVAQASASVTTDYDLTISNTLPNGPTYAVVAVTTDGTKNVQFEVTTPDVYGGVIGPNFGMKTFGFNLPDSLTVSSVSGLPNGWSSSINGSSQLDGFGRFSDVMDSGGNNTTTDLVFDVTLSGDATASTFTASDFAGHIIDCDNTSQWVGGSTSVVPEPATIIVWSLLGTFAVGLVWRGRSRRLADR